MDPNRAEMVIGPATASRTANDALWLIFRQPMVFFVIGLGYACVLAAISVNKGDLQTAVLQVVLPTLLFALCVVMMRAMARRTLPWSTPGTLVRTEFGPTALTVWVLDPSGQPARTYTCAYPTIKRVRFGRRTVAFAHMVSVPQGLSGLFPRELVPDGARDLLAQFTKAGGR
ncbi:hypothetical protein BOO86_00790 [Mycobacterium sp. CBMA 234]|uniref:hypothetical protein n=1 Tax=Mycolicibacterium sp. CBMA 234 TaxID=1918495 RepID=UPI0012DD9EB4|nr:hypothetical protein [Mycolicibacterium sp. CBMA 234]MUL62984.1 hypothetical protein [Mycolicibacterium sp. CBMA 234]